jgi:nucleoside-diphosphate-sugar epimerase
MHVFLTGASGYIGSAVLRALVARGHDVTAILRSDQKAEQAAHLGAKRVAVQDVTDADVVARLSHEADAVIHTASAEAVDPLFLAAAIDALSGTPKPLIHTGGAWIFGNSSDISESSPLSPPEITSWRVDNEALLRRSPVRSTVVAPAVVYGHGAGIPSMFVGDGEHEVRLVGDGSQRWATVHVDDLADLYVAAVERDEAHGYVIGASGDNPSVREMAEAGAHGSPVVAESPDESRARLGAAFADALLVHQEASGAFARDEFSWSPSRPSLLDDLRAGSSTN